MAETPTQRYVFFNSIKMFSAIVYIVSIQRRGVKLNNELSLPLSFNKFEVLKTLVRLNIFIFICNYRINGIFHILVWSTLMLRGCHFVVFLIENV